MLYSLLMVNKRLRFFFQKVSSTSCPNYYVASKRKTITVLKPVSVTIGGITHRERVHKTTKRNYSEHTEQTSAG